ncbi:YoaK family protein [Paraburkholderia sp. UCT2]|uniref:YoaK family protein n=1 Tax=Paraburkholderia sp. UCT2 TaxID=2615208 RepID=UPI001654C9C8|nr:YoaK family protein [Paraburkholderia sp. UCT2]
MNTSQGGKHLVSFEHRGSMRHHARNRDLQQMPLDQTVLSSRHELRLAWSLAAVAGFLNATGFSVAGIFSGNMTGNVTSLADRIATGDPRSGLSLLVIIVLFIVGAMLSALLLEFRGAGNRAHACAIIFMAEAVSLVVLAVIDVKVHTASGLVLVFGLSFLMGCQNATAAVVSNFRVRTTHFSGTSTDIGVKLGLIFAHALQRNEPPDQVEHFHELKAKALTMAAFCVGGVAGVISYSVAGKMNLLISALGIVFLSIPPLVVSSSPQVSA